MSRRLVLLHGFTHTGASWKPVIAGVPESYRPAAPDIRGHGSATDRLPVALDAVVEDVAALIGQQPAVLAGYSMGGRIALHVALALPGRIERLVLVGASPGIADAVERAARRAADERLADELAELPIEALAERWAATPVLAGQPPEVLAAVQADRRRNTPAGLARALRGLGTGALPSLWDRLDELAMPMMLLAGERDGRFTAIAREMAAAIPAAEVEIVAGAGHAVHLEAPGAVAAALVG
jgi:2-succinyl-6-hydroxy-2,4-cyclohexadiene-1-carboxylate synthase